MLAQTFIQAEAEYFREPVMEPGDNGEHGARNQHVVEMRNQEHRIMILVIGTGHRQHNAAESPPIVKIGIKANVYSIGVVKVIRPFRRVNSQLNILTPVGTAIAIVVMEKKLLTITPWPMV